MFDIQNMKRSVSRLTGLYDGVAQKEEAQTDEMLQHGGDRVAYIGPAIEFKGQLRGHENIMIDGSVEGVIEFPDSTVIVGVQGRIEANIHAREIIVEGHVNGELKASEKIIVRRTGNQKGDMTAPRVSLEDGAMFKGCIEMEPVQHQGMLLATTPADARRAEADKQEASPRFTPAD